MASLTILCIKGRPDRRPEQSYDGREMSSPQDDGMEATLILNTDVSHKRFCLLCTILHILQINFSDG